MLIEFFVHEFVFQQSNGLIDIHVHVVVANITKGGTYIISIQHGCELH